MANETILLPPEHCEGCAWFHRHEPQEIPNIIPPGMQMGQLSAMKKKIAQHNESGACFVEPQIISRHRKAPVCRHARPREECLH